MKRYMSIILMGILFVPCVMRASEVSCNNRMRHAPKGIFKGAVAVLSAITACALASDLKNVYTQLRNPYIPPHSRQEVLLNPWLALCALGALGYVTWTFAFSSIESLRIYFHDDTQNKEGETTNLSEHA